MFVGHYGLAAALSGNRIKLWHGAIAVQLLDILWAPLILTGVEDMRIVNSFSASNHFDLYHMPYTHSLVMAIVWSILAGLLYILLRSRAGLIGGLIIGFLVFSHWVLDYLTHIPDLPLFFDGPKVGLGLWNNRPVALSLELALLLVGFVIYFTRTRAKNMIGTMLPLLVLLALIAAQIYGSFGPVPANTNAVALSALGSYMLFAGLAAMLDRMRVSKNTH